MTPHRFRAPVFVLVTLPLLAAACTRLGPDYERPELDVPGTFRELDAPAPAAEGESALGDLEWRNVFGDPALQALIETAVTNNYDVRIAAERVLEARAFLTIVRADLYPDVNAVGGGEFTRASKNGPVALPPGVDKDQESAFVGADLAWEIDFWGRIERSTEAARAELLASEFARRAVAQSLVAAVAEAYYVLLELDEEIEISRRTVESRQRSERLVSLRLEHGIANKVELRQAEGLVLQAAGIIPALEQRAVQVENQLRQLIGANPGPVKRGLPLLEQADPRWHDIPEGLPSELLARRPDVMIAEQSLVAANARIGAAKALLYPSIRLTGNGGVLSDDLSDLFKHDSQTWSIVPSATIPIFNAGRLRANVEVTESQQRQAALAYLQTVQIAFQEVADALIAREKTSEVRDILGRFEATLQDQTRLSRNRYRGGVTSYLEVLDSERDYFDAELSFARSVRDELLSIVFLYRALGGGWQATPAAEPVPPMELPEPKSEPDLDAVPTADAATD